MAIAPDDGQLARPQVKLGRERAGKILADGWRYGPPEQEGV